MKEHVGGKGKIVSERAGPVLIEGEVSGGDQGEAGNEPGTVLGTEADLEKEHQTVYRDQRPGDDRRISRGHAVLHREHITRSPLISIPFAAATGSSFASGR